ncbi:MAG: hypothetical protein VX938_13765, partial [Myxococcota bacterium]|nr:hypothetical protein [Myxococcota bacterium]
IATRSGTGAHMGLCPGSALIFAWPARIDRWRDAGLPWSIGTDCPVCNDGINVQRDLRMTVGIPAMGLGWSPAHQAFMETGELAAAQSAWRVREALRGDWADLRDPARALAHVWRTPGAAHPAFHAGTLTEGALANLVAWDARHPSFWPGRDLLGTLVRGDVTPAISNVMVAGRWRGTHGDYASSLLDSTGWRDAREEADSRLRALRARG